MIGLADPGADPAAVIKALDLRPHPEGGYFRETWRDSPVDGGRGVGTAILFLLTASQRSHWHRVDAAELWLWQAGAPLTLDVHGTGAIVLGPMLAAGQEMQGLVPAGHWQAARSQGAWTLVSCVVTPAFQFQGFELAPPGWSPT